MATESPTLPPVDPSGNVKLPAWLWALLFASTLGGGGGIASAVTTYAGGGASVPDHAHPERVSREDLARIEGKVDDLSSRMTELRVALIKATGEDPGR